MPKPLTVWITTNWKILQEMEIPNHLTCRLRNLYVGQEATVRTGHRINRLVPNWERSTLRLCISPCLFNLHAEYILQNTRPDEAQAGIKIVGRNIDNLRSADGITLMAESEEELKSLLMKGKRRVKKLAQNSTFKKQRSWHPAPSLHSK